MTKTTFFACVCLMASLGNCEPECLVGSETVALDKVVPAFTGKVSQSPVTPPPLAEVDTEWVETTLATMTLEEKIGQMVMPVWNSSSSASSLVTNYNVGGFVFLANSSSTIVDATNSLQAISEVPLIFSIDCEAGSGARITDGTIFPMNMALAASERTDLAFEQGVVTARECRAVGVHIGFGPVLDCNTEPVNPIIGIRSYSDDPTRIETMAEQYVLGAASAGMLTTFKHYPGHGATAGDSHSSLPVVNIPCNELERDHISPYRTLLGKGIGELVMTAHVWYPCLDPGDTAWPATISSAALHDILRQDIGYDGVVITDAFNMGGLLLAAPTDQAAVYAVQYGVDIILMPASIDDVFTGLQGAIDSQQISMDRIDQSVRRILSLKTQVGLHQQANVSPGDVAQTLLHPDHVAVAAEIGADAVAGARIDPEVIPLSTDQQVLLLDMETTSRIFYRYPSTELRNGLSAELPNLTIQTVSASLGTTERQQIVSAATGYDCVLVASRMWKPTNPGQQDQLVNDLIATGVPLVYLGLGSPYHVLQFPEVENYFCAFSSHESSQQEMVRILVGDSTPEGVWPVDLFEEERVKEAWVFF